ncbi:mannose-6-phosphate isomerase, class I [Panacibacter ginsenosidivorans]|uniref:mannose-6-phosphate isomerase n=1 Tax=Panacibacter ginsenosidivorans TaxID=1813871 RepID=A0A5B8VBD0_9BACT|nr:mannose-6-phosphate isomerase, class I [Panacibacter ginsenosidivorans]QEC68652.1 mannose-6-phosphate isomerase, class I [Panacibacter ginsenosidivorans]
MLQDKIFKLKGKVQHYAWGGYDYIPQWLGIANAEHIPYAEYWMGAHPSAPSVIVTQNGALSLNQLVHDHHAEFIGEKVFEQFGELPYLFKILDVKDMLSIQVHPTKAAAAAGFEAEEAAGIKLDSAFRNYKDRNHKPEVMIALSEFWLLHGFREKDALKNVLQTVPEFQPLVSIYGDGNYKTLSEHGMYMQQEEVNAMLVPLIKREIQRKQNGELTKNDPGWWVSKLYEGKEEWGNIDRGVFSIYFFNIVEVHPGEAVFQGAGVPHAYLEGQNVELMANSDNVLRGGLTPKHVDVGELLKHTTFEAIVPNVMKGEQKENGETNYPCPVPDFGISKIELHENGSYQNTANSLEIFVVIDGTMSIKGMVNNLSVSKGEVAVILAGETYHISTDSHVLSYKAFVP